MAINKKSEKFLYGVNDKVSMGSVGVGAGFVRKCGEGGEVLGEVSGECEGRCGEV